MKEIASSYKNKVHFIVLVVSTSMFFYQIVLTRLFSVMFSYHYVFLITSMAILGMGIGSVWSYRYQKDVLNQVQVSRYLTDLSLSYIAIFFFVFYGPRISSPFIYMFVMGLPFGIGGFLFGKIFRNLSHLSDQLYLSDLFGSALGAMFVILSINTLGIIKSIVVICALPLIANLTNLNIFKRNKMAIIYPLLLLLMLITILFIPKVKTDYVEINFKGIYENTNGTIAMVISNDLTPEISYSKWNAFSRTDVISIDEMNDKKYLTIDGGANAPMYKFDGNKENLVEYKMDSGFLPFSFGEVNKSLLIGAGGGRDVLYALAGDSNDITALDINESTIEAVKAFSDYNGHIFDREEVTTVVDDGRGFIEETDDLYDVIFLSLVMTNSSQGVAYALAEDYIYTVEAFSSYLDHLTENGKIGFLVHDLDDMSKIVGMSVQALIDRGIPIEETPDYLSIFSKAIKMESGEIHYTQPVVIVKKLPFNETETNTLASFAQYGKTESLHLPGVWEEGHLAEIKAGNLSLSEYVDYFPSNMRPATDNMPYFYNFDFGVSKTVILVFSFSFILGLLIIGKFLLQKKHVQTISYFSILGVAFMLIEIAIIQKFTLFLGHPTLAIVLVLSSLLIGSGLGSYFGNRMVGHLIGRVYWPAIVIAIINIVVLILFDQVLVRYLYLEGWIKMIIAAIIIIIQGFVMGMPFSRGLLILSKKNESSIIPIMIGVNGVMSVAGSAFAIAISMIFGFSATIMVGALLYISVAFIKFYKEV